MLKTKNAQGKKIRDRLKDKTKFTIITADNKSNNETNLSIHILICCGVMVVHVILPSLSYSILFSLSCGASIVTETVLFP